LGFATVQQNHSRHTEEHRAGYDRPVVRLPLWLCRSANRSNRLKFFFSFNNQTSESVLFDASVRERRC